MALGSTQPLTEMNTRNLPGRKGRPVGEANFITFSEPIVWKMWEPRRLTTLWASTASYRGRIFEHVEARDCLAISNTGIVILNPTQGMYISGLILCVCCPVQTAVL
jgi:hypothetical protein